MSRMNKWLTSIFRSLGEKVALYPKYFIIGSLVLSLTLGTGLLQINYDDDFERLYAHANGPSQHEKSSIQSYFKSNYSGRFSFSRTTELGRFVRLILIPKDDGSVLRTSVWDEIVDLDAQINKLLIYKNGEGYNYSEICARWDDVCFENTFLDFSEIMGSVENGSLDFYYPLMLNPVTYNSHLLAYNFGGVELKEDNFTVRTVKAISLNYFLVIDTKEESELSRDWEKGVIELCDELESSLKNIRILKTSYYSLTSEQEVNTLSVMPHFTFTIFLMFSFTICSALSKDWVKAKPWVALCGIISAFLGTLAAIGLLGYLGVTMIGINIAVPFIMLGIGIDDTFVVLASWRQTNPTDSVKKRLSETYAEAAVSITITSLTDMLSFFVGIFTPISSVQLFCAYAGTSVLGIYIFQIFFFGAVLAISGDQEAGNRHSVFWWIQATPKSKADGKSSLYRIFFTGGIDPTNPSASEDNSENAFMIFFRDSFAKLLQKRWLQLLTLLIFFVYIGVAVWGILNLGEGLQEERTVRDDSYLVDFYGVEKAYFRNYSYRVQVAVLTPLDYSLNSTQNRIEKLLSDLISSSPYLTKEYEENWLTSFKDYVSRYAEFMDLPIHNESSFISSLQNEFLINNNPYEIDLVFSDNNDKIIASRFILQSKNVHTANDMKDLAQGLRQITDAQTDIKVLVYNPWFVFADQFLIIRELTVKLVSIAAIIVIGIALVFIPNIICSICVFFTIVSIEIGVLGFMSIWGVDLDLVSIICLIMCIGFSVDFSAHVSYAYISAEGSPEERVKKAMYSLGYPILQGGISTILGVIALVIVPSYIFQVFFKVVFLVILFATWHGLFVLPVLFLLLKPEEIMNKVCRRKEFNLNN